MHVYVERSSDLSSLLLLLGHRDVVGEFWGSTDS
jgi:hypothetical protein